MPARRHQRWEPTQNQKSSGNVSKGRFLSTFRGLLQPLQGTSMSLEVTIKFSSCNRAKNRSTLLLPITTQHFYLHVADVMYYVLSHATSGGGRPQQPPPTQIPSPSAVRPPSAFVYFDTNCLQLRPSSEACPWAPGVEFQVGELTSHPLPTLQQ